MNVCQKSWSNRIRVGEHGLIVVEYLRAPVDTRFRLVRVDREVQVGPVGVSAEEVMLFGKVVVDSGVVLIVIAIWATFGHRDRASSCLLRGIRRAHSRTDAEVERPTHDLEDALRPKQGRIVIRGEPADIADGVVAVVVLPAREKIRQNSANVRRGGAFVRSVSRSD